MISSEGLPVGPEKNKGRTMAWSLYKFLASIKLAVVLLLALAVILATATFYESLYDTKTAQHLVYGNSWFVVFLALLFINIFCSASIRFPWKKRQTGFVITHLGILFILVGSLQTLLYGVDGQMPVQEGGSNDRVILQRPVLLWGATATSLHEKEAEFRWNPPRPDRPYVVELGGGVVAKVDTYLHHARTDVEYVAAPAGEQALRLSFKSSRFNIDQWITPSMGRVQMGMAQVSLETATQDQIDKMDGKSVEPALEVPGGLGFLVKDQTLQVTAAELSGAGHALGDSPYKARILRYLPDASMEGEKLVAHSPSHDNPCIEIEVTGPEGSQKQVLFAKDSSQNKSLAAQGQAPPVRALYLWDGQKPSAPTGKSLQLLATPEGRIYCRLNGQAPKLLAPDQTLYTGWMDIAISYHELLASARGREVYAPFVMKKGMKDGPPAAIRLTLQGVPDPGPYWLQQGGATLETRDAQNQPFLLAYNFASMHVGIRIELLKFEVGYDPGTRNPASFKSTVKVEGQEQIVEMNEPLHRGNYTFYQASYQENESGPQTSIFSVAYDPGIFAKYLGCGLMMLGMYIMFYIRSSRLEEGGPAKL